MFLNVGGRGLNMESLVGFFERIQHLCCRLFKCGGGVDEVDAGGADGGVEMGAVGGQAGSGHSESSSSSTDVSGEFVLHSKTIRPVCSPTPQ